MTRYYFRPKGSSKIEGPYDAFQIGRELRRRRTAEEIECLEAVGQSHAALVRSTDWRDVREIIPAAASDGADQTSLPASKPCRNCGGAEIYIRDVTFAGDAGALLPVGAFFGAECRVRVCGSCGLAEWFLLPSSLKKAKATFQRE